ncbi:hypothetical protein I4U23_023189 [Adineta vaga]|nr:hypothetical protein I4U23_023189 [Adineta vaga]
MIRNCTCTPERTGIHCEHMINYCDNITCFNREICRPLLLNYKCECLYGASGDDCELIATNIVICQQYVAKSFSYIAILAIAMAIGSIVILDILKYVFGIDVAKEERDLYRHRRALLKSKSYGKQQCPKL